MGYIAIIAVICALVFLIRLQMTRRQVKNIIAQLEDYRSQENEMRLAVSLTDRLLESLTGEINHVIDREVEAQASKLKVERELKDTISGMSHDLRTPLTAIIGYMQLVEQADLREDERKEYLSIAMRRALRLQQLIQNFFSLSVVEEDDYPLNMEEITLTPIIKDTLLSYYDQFQEKDEHLDIQITDEKVRVFADQIACERVIENVILNTIQHAEGGMRFSLFVDGENVVFSVQNEISNSNIHTDQVFNKFYTTDRARKNSGGFGLAIVKSLMKKMNGSVDVRVTDRIFQVVCKWKAV